MENKNKKYCEKCGIYVLRRAFGKHLRSAKHLNESSTYCDICKKNIDNLNYETHLQSVEHFKNEKKASTIKVIKDLIPKNKKNNYGNFLVINTPSDLEYAQDLVNDERIYY